MGEHHTTEPWFAPRVVTGWGATRAISDPGLGSEPGCHRLIELVDGQYRHRDGRTVGPGTCLWLDAPATATWRRVGSCHEHHLVVRIGVGTPDHLDRQWLAGVPDILPEPLASRCAEVLRAMQSLWWVGRWQHRRADALLALLLCDLAGWGHAAIAEVFEPPAADPRLARAEALARTQLNTWRTNDMAIAAGMERAAFSRRYHRERGRTPGEFLDSARMSYAEAVLGQPAPDLHHLARSIGFATVAAFGRWFRRRHGCSPLQWRRRIAGD